MRPARRLPLPAHQHVEQQCRPELPADCLLAVAEEVADLEGLLELLKKNFDAPPRLSWFVMNHPGDSEWDRPPATLKNHGLWDGCVFGYVISAQVDVFSPSYSSRKTTAW